jgi:hypothetical protein
MICSKSVPPALPDMVLVKSDNYTGPHLTGHPGVVPIVPVQRAWTHGARTRCTRRQLPLALAWGVSVHKAQGVTTRRAVVHLGAKEFTPGLTFVAVSRVKAWRWTTPSQPSAVSRRSAHERCKIGWGRSAASPNSLLRRLPHMPSAASTASSPLGQRQHVAVSSQLVRKTRVTESATRCGTPLQKHGRDAGWSALSPPGLDECWSDRVCACALALGRAGATGDRDEPGGSTGRHGGGGSGCAACRRRRQVSGVCVCVCVCVCVLGASGWPLPARAAD